MRPRIRAFGLVAALMAIGTFPVACGKSGDISSSLKPDPAVDTAGRYPIDPSRTFDTLTVASLNMSIGFPVAQMFFKDMDDPAVAYETLMDMYGRYLKGYPTERLKAMGKVVAAESPDVLGLQEVMVLRKGDSIVNDFLGEFIAAIKANGGPEYVVFHTPMNDTVLSGKKGDSTITIGFVEGQSLLVKPGFTLLDSARFMYFSLLKIPLNNQPVTERGADWLRLRSPKGLEFQVFNTHIEVEPFNNGTSQAAELGVLADSLQSRVGKRGRLQLVIGDLNSEPGLRAHRILGNRGFADTFDGPGVSRDSGGTCCVAGSALWRPDTTFSNRRIDYVLARGMGVAELSKTTVKGAFSGAGGTRFLASDHRMVVARFTAQNP